MAFANFTIRHNGVSPFFPERSLREVARIVFDAARLHRTGALTQVSSSIAQHVTVKGLAALCRLFLPKASLDSQLDGFRQVLSSLRPDDTSSEKRFPLWMFQGLNTRGIQDYSSILFEEDLLEKIGFPLEPDQTVLWKLIQALPKGATVADWGGGAGIFGYEIKERRPDLRVYVNDLYSPEEILEQEGAGKPTVADLRRKLIYITGDALQTTFPKGGRADLIISALLTPYLKDPLRLIPHLYNQLKKDGILILSLTPDIYSANIHKDAGTSIISEILQELRTMGLDAQEYARSKTLIIRRSNLREMRLIATRVANHYSVTSIKSNAVGRYLTFYQPQESGVQRWFQLI